MTAASRPKESSIAALTRPNYRSGASNDVDVIKKEIIADYPLIIETILDVKAEEEISEQSMVNPFAIDVGKLVMLQGIARNQICQICHHFQSMASMYHLHRLTPTIISSYQLHSSTKTTWVI